MSNIKVRRKLSKQASLDGYYVNNVNSYDSIEDWTALGADITIKQYKKGDILISEGEKIEYLLFVQDGIVSINCSDGESTIKKTPELYGESWFLNKPSTSTIIVTSNECTVILINIEQAVIDLFKPIEEQNNNDNTKSSNIKSDKLRVQKQSLVRIESPNREDIHSFMKQISVKRFKSDPSSEQFSKEEKRKLLFFKIAAKLIYRLHNSIDHFKTNIAVDSVPTLKVTAKLSNELLVSQHTKKTHTRTPSKTFVSKMLSKASIVTGKEDFIKLKKNNNNKSHEKFIKRFRLPKEEKLMLEFNTSWIPEDRNVNPLGGKLYFGEHYVCFFGNGFAFHTKTITPLNVISSWNIEDTTLYFDVSSEDTKYQYNLIINNYSEISTLKEFLSDYATNSQLLRQSVRTLQRNESWVLKHNIDPIASDSFILQDCISLLTCSERHFFKKGDVIIKDGEKQIESGVWKIASGRVKIESKDGNILSVLGKNSFFGEITFFFPEVVATASIIALDDVVQVFFLPSIKLEEQFQEFPNFAARFYKYMATIVAHRFERFNRLYLSEFANHICRQNICKLSFIDDNNIKQIGGDETMVQLTKQFLKFSSSLGTVGKISLADLQSISLDGNEIFLKTLSDNEVILQFKESYNEWILSINSASYTSYDIQLLSYDYKLSLLEKSFKSIEECEIRFCLGNGSIEEQWFYYPIRDSIISLSIDRDTQCQWNGYLFTITNPKGKVYKGYGIWDGLCLFWYPNSYPPQDVNENNFYNSNSDIQICLIWYNSVMSFQSDIGKKSYTMHNTKIHKKQTNTFSNAIKLRDKDAGPKSSHIIADILTPPPLLMFLYLANENTIP